MKNKQLQSHGKLQNWPIEKYSILYPINNLEEEHLISLEVENIYLEINLSQEVDGLDNEICKSVLEGKN